MTDPILLIQHILPPLARLLVFISLGILVGILIENLRWSTFMARLATPLVRIAHLQPISGASFAMAFFRYYSQFHAGRGLCPKKSPAKR